jgi:hypothetical protein
MKKSVEAVESSLASMALAVKSVVCWWNLNLDLCRDRDYDRKRLASL